MNNDKSVKKGILSGSGSGILAILCCIGPLVIILFGLGTISFAVSVSQYRPYFIALGIFFLFLAILLHLRKKNNLNVNGLKREKHFIISAVLSMGIVYFAVLYAVVPAIVPAIYGNVSVRNPNPVDTNSNLHKVALKIDGMTCSNCADIIEGGLQGLDGVVEAKVSYSEGVGEVIYDPGKITKEQIVESDVFTTNYIAEIISDELLK